MTASRPGWRPSVNITPIIATPADGRVRQEGWKRTDPHAPLAATRASPAGVAAVLVNHDVGLHAYYVEAGNTPVLVHNEGGGSPLNDTIGLEDGYSGRLDQFDYGQGADFEIHVYSRGTEVGIFGSDGFFAKHGLSANVSVPDDVYNRLKGKAIEFMRSTGRIGPQGTQGITGDKWKTPRLGGGC